jgi:hypothetical protein
MSGNKERFESIDRIDVPHGRKGKHNDIIGRILQELGELRNKKALKIPRSALGNAKIEHIRAALSRASGKEKLQVSTSSDDEYFYVWREE